MCELRSHLHASVETRQHRTLPVQRLRAVPQDERPEQTAHQTQAQAGESHECIEECVVCMCVCLRGGSK